MTDRSEVPGGSEVPAWSAQSGSEMPGGPAVEGPAVEGPAVEGPAVEGPAVEGPAVEGPAVEGPAVEGPAVEGHRFEEVSFEGVSFEGLMDALEGITARLAQGDIGIEVAADLYEQAERLHAVAAERLAQVQERVVRLSAPGEAGPEH